MGSCMHARGATCTLGHGHEPSLPLALAQDDVYTRVVTGACHEAVRRLLGPFRALEYSR